jgi:hypothetical protein
MENADPGVATVPAGESPPLDPSMWKMETLLDPLFAL